MPAIIAALAATTRTLTTPNAMVQPGSVSGRACSYACPTAPPLHAMGSVNGMHTPYGFTGQREDSSAAAGPGASGLDYYGARYYDPVLGQFASADGLSNIGFTGTVGVVAHSNAAVALFQYMAEAYAGKFKGDPTINSFVALDAPVRVPLIESYSGFTLDDSQLALDGAAGYVRSHGTRGAYAASTHDWLSMNYSSDAWDSYMVPAGPFSLDPTGAHLAISHDPDLSRYGYGDLALTYMIN